MLINRQKMETQFKDDIPAPVPGLVHDNIPTTADVHLYSDPSTYTDEKPILYADCEGFTGGETTPRGSSYHLKGMENLTKSQQNVENVCKVKRLQWDKDPKKHSREFTVASLFPRILYSFSDVVVFVLREVR